MKKVVFIFLCLPFFGITQCISGDCSNGYGEFIFENGDKYIGYTKNNLRDGKGEYIVKQNANDPYNLIIKYSGEWKNNKSHGVVTTTTKDGKSLTNHYHYGEQGKFINFTGEYRFEAGESSETLVIFELESSEKDIAYITFHIWEPSRNDDEDGTWGTGHEYLTNFKLNNNTFTSDEYNGHFEKIKKYNDSRDSVFVLYDKKEKHKKTFYKSDVSVKIKGWMFSIYKFDKPALSECVHQQNLNLQVLRNGIFANHGYIFKYGGKMDNYFRTLSWYQPIHNNVDHLLSDIEKHNIRTIQSIENDIKKYPNSKRAIRQETNFPK